MHKVADFKRNDPKILFKELAFLKLFHLRKIEKKPKVCKKYNS